MASPTAVFVDNNLGSNRAYLRELCQALRPLNKIWSAAVSIDVTDDPISDPRHGSRRMHGRVCRIRITHR